MRFIKFKGVFFFLLISLGVSYWVQEATIQRIIVVSQPVIDECFYAEKERQGGQMSTAQADAVGKACMNMSMESPSVIEYSNRLMTASYCLMASLLGLLITALVWLYQVVSRKRAAKVES